MNVSAYTILCLTKREQHKYILKQRVSEKWCRAADAIPVWFLVEEAFWLFCDSGGRHAWKASHNGEFVKYKHWIAASLTLFEGWIQCEDKPRFWRSANNAYGRHKTRMEVASALVLSADKTKLLLVQTINRDKLSLPGGKCHVQEGESVQDCLHRELREELGWHKEQIHVLDTHDVFEGRQFHLFLVQEDRDRSPKIDRKEIVDYRWVSFDQAKELNISKLVEIALSRWCNKKTLK